MRPCEGAHGIPHQLHVTGRLGHVYQHGVADPAGPSVELWLLMGLHSIWSGMDCGRLMATCSFHVGKACALLKPIAGLIKLHLSFS